MSLKRSQVEGKAFEMNVVCALVVSKRLVVLAAIIALLAHREMQFHTHQLRQIAPQKSLYGARELVVQRLAAHPVSQVAVSFAGHRLLDLSSDAHETRRLMLRRAYDHLLEVALGGIGSARTERADLKRQRDSFARDDYYTQLELLLVDLALLGREIRALED